MGAKQFFGGQCWRFKLINSFHVDLGCGDARGPFRISPRVRKYDTNRNFMHFFLEKKIKITIHFCIKFGSPSKNASHLIGGNQTYILLQQPIHFFQPHLYFFGLKKVDPFNAPWFKTGHETGRKTLRSHPHTPGRYSRLFTNSFYRNFFLCGGFGEVWSIFARGPVGKIIE